MNKLNDLILMPRLYLANYFTNLKEEIDLAFIQQQIISNASYSPLNNIKSKSDEISRLEMMNRIDMFIKECFRNIPTTLDINNLACNEIEEFKNKFEQNLFKNKTIIFLSNYGWNKQTYLLIINDEYFNKKKLFHFKSTNNILSHESMKLIYLKQKLAKIIEIKSVIEFNLDVKNLTKLYLGEIKLHSIQDNTFECLNKLKVLYLWQNSISKITSETFNGLVNLNELMLNDNKIKKIQDNSFFSLNKLEILRLDGNQLSELNEFTFNGLNNVKELWLQNNKIHLIKDDSFKCLNSLKDLKLNNNRIQMISEYLFSGLVKLEKLWLIRFNCDRNKKLIIQSNSFIGLINLKEIYYSKNNKDLFEKILFKNRNILKKAW